MEGCKMNIQKCINIISQIPGWLSALEQTALIHLPLFVDHLPGSIVEIGSFQGKSTVCLGLGSLCLTTTKRPIYAIDPFDHEMYTGWIREYEQKRVNSYFDSFWANIKNAGLEHMVIPIRKLSHQAYQDCPKSIAALFIDGDHSYQGVKHDIDHYVSRVISGGYIAFHDYTNTNEPGVKKAVDELCMMPDYTYFADYDSLRVVKNIR